MCNDEFSLAAQYLTETLPDLRMALCGLTQNTNLRKTSSLSILFLLLSCKLVFSQMSDVCVSERVCSAADRWSDEDNRDGEGSGGGKVN